MPHRWLYVENTLVWLRNYRQWNRVDRIVSAIGAYATYPPPSAETSSTQMMKSSIHEIKCFTYSKITKWIANKNKTRICLIRIYTEQMNNVMLTLLSGIRRDALVLSVSASHAVGRELAHRRGYTKDHHKNDTNCIPAWHAGIRVRIWQWNLTV